VFTFETGPTEPTVDVFLHIIHSRLDLPNISTKTRGNCLWALAHAVANRSASDELLTSFVDQLIVILKRTDDDPTCIINAAWALTSICAPRATDANVVDVTTCPDVFLHLSGLIRAEFPRRLEKLAIFSNFCRMLPPVVNKVSADVSRTFTSLGLSGDQQESQLSLTNRAFVGDCGSISHRSEMLALVYKLAAALYVCFALDFHA